MLECYNEANLNFKASKFFVNNPNETLHGVHSRECWKIKTQKCGVY